MYERGGNADSVDRRIEADEVDFKFFENYDISISNPFYKIGDLYEAITEWMDLPNTNELLLKNVSKI